MAALEGDSLSVAINQVSLIVWKVSNIGAQCRGAYGSTHSWGDMEASLLPKPKMFSGKISKGYRFIKNFMLRTNNMDKTTRIALFKALCGSEVISWLLGQDFTSWDKLNKSFKSNWCKNSNQKNP